ncbi:hypothetical protein O0I10_010815 [Lichtheimia ornata]|uniref:BHLH domain-containing protein n=1 Tax=Lichtheimia ornata TaxID=688661 RepID=A0AAD7UU33_9FUNG|nr:uncharacterized protein O0I10_010815 [Lichtheimia ornata]KAJ8653487.1 hypothetical protein O0I10_010815 [Lichtheimia ornata]
MNLQGQSQPQSLPYTPNAAAAAPPTFFDPASYHQEPIMYPPMPQFSAHGPAVSSQHHPEQQRIQQLNMRHALLQNAFAQQQQQQHQPSQPADLLKSPNKRTPSKAERRAEHNAIERARRENLNSKFQQLAHALPNLQNDRRPSKGTIIERTLDYVRSTMAKEEHYQYQIRVLLKENRRMKRQLKKRRETSSGESVSSSEHDELFMTSPAFLGWEQPPPMSSSSSSSAAAVAAAATAAAISRPMTATGAPSSYNMYMAPAPSSSFTNHSPPVGATLSYYDDDDDSDSASYTHMPVESYPMTMMMGAGDGNECTKVMHPPPPPSEYQVKMESSRQLH